MKNLIIATSLTVLGSMSLLANAGSSFDMLDTDGNGAISLSESKALPKLMAQFKDLDTDGNGELSQSEYEKFSG
ncbi:MULTISPECIES: calmodulin [Pseudoalteromonas]|uniref:Calmodulin n=1 Tax=Pseudoalteromonas amylolytica TaxID=1859457 RepID=A0A1S1MP74_9GAMM|nr:MULTISPECIES: calmodulin [Pseudoalteromonas]MCF6437226.1 EF-hand domain-containing protein [Pseudoalteromonas sp. MMG022]OHU84330.1 calmodulin [Pseudoalteromonas sp. JW3]OHU87131.1 calmodulin [Pseudoalteromonas amylolytica]